MSKVALRVYNREIETLVDQGHIEEAIAHCQNILKLYPKHLETYRLLGKAYLEARRHADAADIFQRVLMSVPDDFVSQLGMSLVRDEQKDLDGAIWHMERAFEVNPSNGAVQGELRRLYGRRDGLEPPKIRLTRGALAHMYTKGGQYQQAIAEIKSVLAEDATRVDMKILMARAFHLAGKKVEATEICIELLKEYPYCLDANRILVEVLPGTASLSQSRETYKKRVQALDPYAALITTGSIFDIDSVPDNSVILERLEWDPGAAPQDSFSGSPAQPAEPIPDFLRSSGWGPSTGEFQEGHVDFGADEPAAAAPAGLAAAEIPDWLKAMAPPGSSAPAGQGTPAADQNLQPEDLDWLSGLGGPVSGGSQAPQPAAAPASSTDQPDWLKDMGGSAPLDQPQAESQSQTAESDLLGGNRPDWMRDSGTVAAAGAAGVAAEEGLDWLQTLNSPSKPDTPSPSAQPNVAPADDLDWLKNLGGLQDTASPEPAAPVSVAPVSQPDAAPADDLDWLKNLGGPQDTSPSEPVAPISAAPVSQPKPETKAPKGFSGGEDAIPPLTAAISGPGTSESEQDDAMKWLESLAQKQGAKSEELITKPGERTETAPSWVAKVDETPAVSAPPAPPTFMPEKPVEIDHESPPGELSPLISGPGTTSSEQDDAMNWLESLAQKQGAKAEELITNPAQRTENIPGWVDQVQNPPAPVSGPGTSASEQDDAMKWLEGLAEKQGAKAEELITHPAERTDAVPSWAAQTSEQPTTPAAAPVQPPPAPVRPPVAPVQPPPPPPAAVQPPIAPKKPMAQDDPNFVPGPLSALVSGPGTSESEQDDAMKWLESLAEKQGAKAEELITHPAERTDAVPSWATQTGEQPTTPAAAPVQPPPPPPAAVQPSAVPVQPPPAPVRPPVAPIQPPPAAVQPPVAPKKPMAQDDPNFVPGPLSALVSGPGTSESEQDDAMKWLESLAEKQGAKAEELITHPAERTDAVPSWATQTSEQPTTPAAAPVEPPQPAPVQPPVAQVEPPPLPPAAVQPAPAAQDDDTMAWLQGLAAGEAMSQAPADVPAEPPAHQPAAGRMPWEQEETPAQPAEELSWEAQTPPVAEQGAPNAEPQPASDVSEWLKNLDMQDQGQPASSPAASADQLPDWLNPAQQGQAADEGLPDWLKDSSADEQPASPAPAPTWIPDSQATPPAPAEAPQLIFSPPLEETPAPPAPVPSPVPAGIPASTPTPTTPAPLTPVHPAVRQTGMLGDKDSPILQNARQSMEQGGLDAAIGGYVKLIKRTKFLEEIIYDLKEATYTHPVDVVVWQTLGDAHMRANQLQDALDAYTKAEELLR